MRHFKIAFSLFLSLGLPFSSSSQTATTQPNQALTLVQQSLAALNAKQAVTDVTATAIVHSIAGSDDETGTATIKAVSVGASRMDLSLNLGLRSEIMNLSSTQPAGWWVESDGVKHQMALHNLMPGPFWFSPAFALSASSSAPGALVTYVGHETHNGQAVEHITVTQTALAISSNDAVIAHLAQLDFFLDSTSLLPIALDFNVHPDNNELVDIPIEICFLNYNLVSGVQVPFHVEKFFNNSLFLDLQITSVTLNSGISVAQIVGN